MFTFVNNCFWVKKLTYNIMYLNGSTSADITTEK